MTPDQTLVAVAIVGTIGTLANVWLTLSIQKSILGLKLWTRENFVAKDDMSTYLSPLKESITIIGGEHRLRNLK